MSEEIRRSYEQKYYRHRGEMLVPAAENPFPQMKHDSVVLRSTEDFGGLGAEIDWQFIDEPLDMFPGGRENDRERYIVLMGGCFKNILELGGAVEISLGTSPDELYTFAYEEAVAVHIEAGIWYDIRVTRVDGTPLFFNQLTFGVYGGEPGARSELCGKRAEREDFAPCLQTKDVIWARHHPHHEVVYPSITLTSRMFGGKTPLRRSWMAISDPFAMEIKSHTHDFHQYLSFCGTDPDCIGELGGTVKFTVGETPDTREMFSSDRACQFFVKQDLYHSPLIFRSVDDPEKPVLFCETSFTDNYGRSPELGDSSVKSEFEIFAEKIKSGEIEIDR